MNSWQVKLTSEFFNGRIELGFKAVETALRLVSIPPFVAPRSKACLVTFQPSDGWQADNDGIPRPHLA